MRISAWIISYFGDEEILRLKRLAKHRIQLQWLKMFAIPITVLSQDYRDNEFENDIKYEVVSGDILLPGKARNCLLRRFYSSNYDYGLFMDNDSILDPRHLDGDNLLGYLLDLTVNELLGVDLFVPINPGYSPFKKDHQENKDIYYEYLWFHRHLGVNTSIFFLKNLGRLYDHPIYFDDSIDHFEDEEFALQVAFAGFGTYMCRNIVLKEMASSDSTLDSILFGKLGRKDYGLYWKRKVVDKWLAFGVKLKSDGKTFDRREFFKNYFRKPMDILVPKPGMDPIRTGVLF